MRLVIFDAVIFELAEKLNTNNPIEDEEKEQEQGNAPNLLTSLFEDCAVR